ncbi:MAG: ABC transporter ATP-binding protein [Firmicutes bacterium]|nr:ABC transporter ATP-binding protein [Bacillota bacterium]
MHRVEMAGIRLALPGTGGPVAVLDDVSLCADEGQFVSVLGPSGCGKSTLFNVLAGLLTPDSGDVYVGGQKVTGRIGPVAYMPQKDLLLPWRNVIDNAIVGLEVAGVSKEKARERAREIVPLFGLEGFEGSLPSALSGGMRQRVALMRTILLDRKVLALDEPFGALDALTRRQMQAWLARVQRQLKQTVLFITHDIDEALALSDAVVVLSQRPARVLARLEVGAAVARRPGDSGLAGLKQRVLEILEADGWMTSYDAHTYSATAGL